MKSISIFELKFKDLFCFTTLMQVRAWDIFLAIWLILIMIFGNFIVGIIGFAVWDVVYLVNKRITALEDKLKDSV